MKGIGMAASAISFFAEPAMFRPCRNSLAPLHAIAFGGIRKEFIKTDLCFISLDFKVSQMEKETQKVRVVNKGGRPKAQIKRDCQLTVMCNIIEKKMIQANAKRARTNVSIYLRQVGLNGRITVKTLPKEVLQFTGTLNHMAANLNQIARKRNKGEDLNTLDRALLNQEVRGLQSIVKEVKNYLA
ncbi:plasmid mobilization protein [Mucilaginibacter sp. P25]|uniref:Mobilisation protein (MobC) n=1 Tax=Mucilaginibacter gossypii TaxID=551996 RepID=A0A1G8EWP2_9SPHI|nr:hypothetical protein [Mucilaginibacter gossypii]SDH74326.1 hypothetical protein SAMN05192573_11276 [Mucilaginibacter gossypii]